MPSGSGDSRRNAQVGRDDTGELLVRLVRGVAERFAVAVEVLVEVVQDVGERVGVVHRALEHLPALADQPAPEEVEGVVARPVEQNPRRAPQIPAVGAVVAGLEVTGEVQYVVRVQLDEPFDEQVGVVLGVALDGLAGRVHQLPELRLVHHGSSIGPEGK